MDLQAAQQSNIKSWTYARRTIAICFLLACAFLVTSLTRANADVGQSDTHSLLTTGRF
jgi:hypothetical protein